MANTKSPIDPKTTFAKWHLDVEGQLEGQTEARLADLRSGAAWGEFCDAIKQVGQGMLASEFAADDRERADGYRYLMGLISKELQQVLYRCQPELPAFVRGMDDVIKWGLDNPDGVNSWAAQIADRHTYRIYGRFGGERFVQFVLTGPAGTLANHFLHQFEVGADGRFEIMLSREPQPGNWMPMPELANEIFVRRIQYDWDAEGYSEVHIERPGATGVPAPLQIPPPERVAAELRALAKVLVNEFEFWQDYTRAFRREGDNVIPADQPLASDGYSKVRQTPKGFFVLEPDQAMLLEFDDPGGLFWSVAVGDTWFRSFDPSHRQTSLNGLQAVKDADGLYRVVVAHEDPGIANWLDTAGYRRGALTFRYVVTERQPAPRLTVAPLPEILAKLPADTARVTPQDRAETIARRARAYSRRYAEPMTSRWRRFD
jgi:hypothetical protein